VPPSLRFFGSKHRAEIVNTPERHRVGLGIQLPALRQEDFLILEVIDWEQRRGSLARGGRENWRIGENEPPLVEKIADRGDHFVPHAQDGRLPLRSNPQVPSIEQIIDAVLFGRNRVVRRVAYDLEIRDVELVTAWCPAVSPHAAMHHNRGFLGEMIGGLELVIADGGLRDDRLDKPGAVAHGQKVDFAARPTVVQPAADRDLLSAVPGYVFNVDDHQSMSG
jgi:hypothetical protein